MKHLKLLRKQVKAAWKLEEDLPPKLRESHQWQFLAFQNKVPYLVGKGGANTFFYKVGEKGKMEYGLPDEVFAVIDKWCGDQYVMYAITRSKNIAKARRTSRNLQELLARTHSKYADYYITGLRVDDTMVRLYVMMSGLMGKHKWVKVSSPKAATKPSVTKSSNH